MISQNLINELIEGYTQGRFEEKYLKGKIHEVLETIIPQLAALVRSKKEKEIIFLWESMKENEKIKDWFRKTLTRIDRPIVIYVASKFVNNQYVGTQIIEEALKWQ